MSLSFMPSPSTVNLSDMHISHPTIIPMDCSDMRGTMKKKNVIFDGIAWKTEKDD